MGPVNASGLQSVRSLSISLGIRLARHSERYLIKFVHYNIPVIYSERAGQGERFLSWRVGRIMYILDYRIVGVLLLRY